MSGRRFAQPDHELLERLHEQEHQLAEAERLAQLGRWQWLVADDRVIWSDQLFRLFGVEPREPDMSYGCMLELIHQADRERLDALVLRALERHEPYDLEHRVVRSDGEVRWVRGRGKVIVDGSGIVVRLDGTCQDITEIRHAAASATELRELLDLVRAGDEVVGRASSIGDAFAGVLELLGAQRQWASVRMNGGGSASARGRRAPAAVRLPVCAHDREVAVLELIPDAPIEPAGPLLTATSLVTDRLGLALERLSADDGAADIGTASDDDLWLHDRAAFMEHLRRALPRARRHGWSTAVMVIDAGAAQAVGAAIAACLQRTVRASDAAARWRVVQYEHERFLLLCEDVNGPKAAAIVAERVASALSDLAAQVRIGIAFVDRDEPADAADCIAGAERAVRELQTRRLAGHHFSSEPAPARVDERAWHESELRDALTDDELTLEYQPIVALGSDRLAAVEALVRWDHPEQGRIPPDRFIPVAEQTGLIEEIGLWVLDRACRDAARWHRATPLKPPLVVSVNVSPRQFRPELCDTVRGVLEDTGLTPGQLRLEITESSVMQDIEGAIDVLAAIKRLGVRLSMDDFGTGYSSLSYLHRLPVDQIKADRSFIGHLTAGGGDAAIVAAIVSLAAALSLDVVAEGVETHDQLRVLRELGYDYVQGYLLARPQPAASVQRLIADAAAGARLMGAASAAAREPARRTVVIADDAAEVLQLASMSLSAAGFTVHVASSGTEALRIASEVVPDCVVLDTHMPGRSGLDVLHQLRTQPRTRRCVIIMLTAAASAEDKVAAFSLGADDYIVKPFSPRDLVGRVGAALRRGIEP